MTEAMPFQRKHLILFYWSAPCGRLFYYAAYAAFSFLRPQGDVLDHHQNKQGDPGVSAERINDIDQLSEIRHAQQQADARQHERAPKSAPPSIPPTAAKALDYTQAGISYIVNALENELGFRLFIREHGGVRLSAEGEILLPYFRQLENDERLLKNKINDLHDVYCGSIKVLVFTSVAVHWIPYILREYRRDYPGISVELISVENSLQAEEMLSRQDADLGFLFHEPRRSGIDVFPLMKERR